MKNILKHDKIFEYTKTIIFFLLLGFLTSYILVEVFLPNSTAKVFGFKPVVVITGSMDPVIKENDLVLITNFKVEELEVGDIITFLADFDYDNEKEIITHYIYSIRENTDGNLIFRTRPYFRDDQVVSPDNWFLTESDILGLYSFHIPRIGTFVRFLQSPFGIAAVIVNVGVIISVVYIIKHTEKKVEAKEEEPQQE